MVNFSGACQPTSIGPHTRGQAACQSRCAFNTDRVCMY